VTAVRQIKEIEMNEFVLVDILFMAIAVAATWAAHYLAQPPPSEAPNHDPAPPPLLAASHGVVSWTGATLEIHRPAAPLDEALRRICNSSGYRSIDVFLDGAKLAYEDVSNAFASGELDAQKHLLSETVYETFAEAIATRASRAESVELTFIGVGAADITDAGLGNGQAWIDVRFVGMMVSVTRDARGQIVAGHPGRVIELTEIWTFERELRAADPNWLLTATEADE
jgi:predicted lipid-binding transport protein (Tim44 family)